MALFNKKKNRETEENPDWQEISFDGEEYEDGDDAVDDRDYDIDAVEGVAEENLWEEGTEEEDYGEESAVVEEWREEASDEEDDYLEEESATEEELREEAYGDEDDYPEEESTVEEDVWEENAEEEEDDTDEEYFAESDDAVEEEFAGKDDYIAETPDYVNALDEEDYIDEDYGEDALSFSTGQSYEEEIQILDMDRSGEDEDDETFLGFLVNKVGQRRLFLGAALLIFGIFAAAAAVTVTGKESGSVEAFSSVSSTLENVDVIGGEGLSALMESRNSAYQAAHLSDVETEPTTVEYEETDESNQIYVELVMTSVEKDLKIKFTNAGTGKLIANVPFSVSVIDSNQKEYTWTDEDKDGIIYMSGLVSGTYRVTTTELEGELYERYTFSTVSQTVTVRDTIVYETVDVSAEIKEEAEINVAEEEAQVELEVESVRTDTVEWVESTKTLASESYTQIDKSEIQVPTATSVARSFLATAQTNESTEDEGTDSETDGETDLEADGETDLEADEGTDLEAGEGTDSGADEETSSEVSVAATAAATVTYSDFTMSLDNTSLSLAVDTSGTLNATVSTEASDADLTYTYTSSDTSVATVSGSGSSATITAVAAGTATITVTVAYSDSSSGISARSQTCMVTVSKTYSAITLSIDNSTLALTVGKTGTIAVTASGETSGETLKYEYSSDDISVATVSGSSASATITAVAAGAATITVRVYYENDTSVYSTVTCAVTVSQTYSDFMVSLDNSSLSLAAEETGSLGATVSGATSGESLTYEYSSSDTGVATVSGSGSSATITGVAAGTATITVKVYYTNDSSKSATATCAVTVSKTYSEITLSVDNSTLSLTAGKTGTITVTASGETSGESLIYGYSSDDTDVATVSGSSDSATITAVAAGTATITAMVYYEDDTSVYSTVTCEVTVRASSTTALKTTDGQAVYVLEDGEYRVATYNDYYTDGMTYYVKTESYIYTGWQTISGSTYYYDADGNRVTGTQVLQGIEYTFDSEGALQGSAGTLGIDVSSHNGSIDWSAVANSGVSFAIIRCGYRGYGSGVLVEDSRFRANIQGAINAGVKVGVYFFSQAISSTEAVEEASMVLQLVSGYSLSYPIYIDVEYSNSSHDGRADSLSVSERTAIVKAFCQTVVNSGYSAGIYANKTWLTSFLDMSQLSSYKVWLAQYAAAPTYSGSFHMWQYSATGSIGGISGNVDLNLWYY